MKKQLLVGLVSFAVAATAIADIQDPPSNDYGPTRKLGRGIANLLFASAELPVTVGRINKEEGNSAAASYGIVRGLGRSTARHAVGLLEILTFPIPMWHDSYRPVLPSDIPWIHAGYSEFPPELGNESKYPYCRDY
ncbi:MAG TPA: exosortase system-associated protein, TIGR04073 family [Chthoniobacterales bacterium]|jgi:putative exosortase-associated protein (TIGR04073 family)|nr:exosortase system-associated protein, TIGR04073 family [Chthoniobacterales bacterium]